MKKIAIYGYNPRDFEINLNRNKVTKNLLDLLRKIPKAEFVVNPSQGFNQIVAMVVIYLRDIENYEFNLEVNVVISGEEKRWTAEEKDLYKLIKSKADEVVYLEDSHDYTVLNSPRGKFDIRKYMEYEKKLIRECDTILATHYEGEIGAISHFLRRAKKDLVRSHYFYNLDPANDYKVKEGLLVETYR